MHGSREECTVACETRSVNKKSSGERSFERYHQGRTYSTRHATIIITITIVSLKRRRGDYKLLANSASKDLGHCRDAGT